MFWRSGLALITLSGWCHAAELELVSRLLMTSEHDRFGGISAIDVFANGQRAYLLSDRGNMYEMTLPRDAARLTGKSAVGQFVGWTGGDSEGLAVNLPDIFVSYEWPSRVDRPWMRCLPSHNDFAELQGNRALEALAVTEDGVLYVASEAKFPEDVGFPIYRSVPGGWAFFQHLDPVENFRPVGADFGPDGWLYILERSFGLWGFRSQIRRLNPAQPDAPEFVWTSDPAEFDNLEGISVWEDQTGQTRITMVSDDNFMPFVRGELVEFILRDQLANPDPEG